MRTIIDLSEEQIAALDRLRQEQGVSRAELIREAVTAYLVSQKRVTLKERPGFGSWKRKRVDGVKYQQRIRSEWDR